MLPRSWNPSIARPRPQSLHSTLSPWHSVDTLHDSSIPAFRREAFNPSLPILLPRGHFRSLPALQKWFHHSPTHPPTSTLAHAYLTPFHAAVVPLELTRLSGASAVNTPQSTCTFYRADAPLGLFLAWAKSADAQTPDRLYLAQASISALPAGMRDDLPTPNVVCAAGKGDVYDANVWVGVPPTYTPLHRDPNPNLFVQLAGQKIVRLLGPEAGHRVFADVQAALGRSGSESFRGEEMMSGEEKKLLEALVWGTESEAEGAVSGGYEACLERGDGLFIPQGWWHSIRGVGEGITGSVSGRLVFWPLLAKLLTFKPLGQLVVPLMVSFGSSSLPLGSTFRHRCRQNINMFLIR